LWKAKIIEPTKPPSIFLVSPHRLFFLMTAVYGTLAMALWLGGLSGALPFGPGWHGHEMIFGFVGATIAGFLLTAVPRWTGQAGLKGYGLLALFGLWVLGRLTMAFDGPGWLDMLFLPALAVVVARDIVAGRNWRNLAIPVVLVCLSILNIRFHFDSGMIDASDALRASVFVITALISLIGGRVIPPFTSNALGIKITGGPFAKVLEVASVPAVLSVAALSLAAPDSALFGVAALTAALVLGARMVTWRLTATFKSPILWVLHAGYAWLPIGYCLVGLAALTGWPDLSNALHGLTTGAVGVMILAMASRAALGHAGRALTANAATHAAYWLVLAAAVIRVFAPADWLEIAGGAWVLSYGIFAIAFWPVLMRPRVDGNPG
jgi:uncharacterized protein involved in response to NO